jgi:hypothetical protein
VIPLLSAGSGVVIPLLSAGSGVVIPLIDQTTPHICAFSKPGPRFPTSYVVVFSNNLRWQVNVRFFEIGGIVDYHF